MPRAPSTPRSCDPAARKDQEIRRRSRCIRRSSTADTAAVRFRTQLIDVARMRTRVSSGSSGSASIVDSEIATWACGIRGTAGAEARASRIQRSLCHDRPARPAAWPVSTPAEFVVARSDSPEATVGDCSRTHRLVAFVEERFIMQMPTITAVRCADSLVVIAADALLDAEAVDAHGGVTWSSGLWLLLSLLVLAPVFGPAPLLAGSRPRRGQGTPRGAGPPLPGGGGDDRRPASRHPAGAHHVRRRGARLRRAGAGVQRRLHAAGHDRRRAGAPGAGTVRAGAPLDVPTATTAVSSVLPGFDSTAGLPIEFGRMEPTRSDPTVHQQYGMVSASRMPDR